MAEELAVGMKCIKYMMFISNFMFVIIGILLISIGSTITSIYGDFYAFMEYHHFSPVAIIITVGIMVLFVAVFGCVGAIRESTLLVNVYSNLLCVILILEMSAAVTAYAMRYDAVEIIERNMFASMDDYGRDELSTRAWDFTQERLICCGVHKIQDWSSHEIHGIEITVVNETFVIPRSCCIYSNCESCYEHGCLDRLAYIISECALLLGTGAVCVTLIQIMGVTFARMLARTIRRNKTREEMKRQLNRQRIYNQLARAPQGKLKSILHKPKSLVA